jgi:hypothetical protein
MAVATLQHVRQRLVDGGGDESLPRPPHGVADRLRRVLFGRVADGRRRDDRERLAGDYAYLVIDGVVWARKFAAA